MVIAAFLKAWNENPQPFVWTATVAIRNARCSIPLLKFMNHRFCSTATARLRDDPRKPKSHLTGSDTVPTFRVHTPDAANIRSVVLVRPSAVTHAFDMERRLVGLSFTAGSGVLHVTGPTPST